MCQKESTIVQTKELKEIKEDNKTSLIFVHLNKITSTLQY